MADSLLIWMSRLLVLLVVIAACNVLRILVKTLNSVRRGGEARPSAIRKACNLWTRVAITALIAALFTSFAETVPVGGLMRFPFLLLYLTGLLMLASALAAGVAAVALSMSRAEDGLSCGGILEDFVLRDIIIAVLAWISAWAIS